MAPWPLRYPREAITMPLLLCGAIMGRSLWSRSECRGAQPANAITVVKSAMRSRGISMEKCCLHS